MRTTIFCLALALALAGAGPLKGAEPDTKIRVGSTAPDFMLRDREGNMHKLSDVAFKGAATSWKKKRKVLLDFFRTDCKPCMKELPQVVRFHDKYKDSVQVYMIALLEDEDGRAKLDQWLKRQNVPFTVLLDPYETAAKKYIVEGDTVSLPSIFFIDESGVVRARLVGLKEDLETEIKKTAGSHL